jgi:hypothetical protein
MQNLFMLYVLVPVVVEEEEAQGWHPQTPKVVEVVVVVLLYQE